MTDMDKMMIEKVARAIAPTSWAQKDAGGAGVSLDYTIAKSLSDARAAITAYNPDDRLREALGAINEARVHLSDLTGKGLGSVDSADEVLASVSLSPLPQGDG